MSETKSTVLVKHHLKMLKLPTRGRECEKVALRASASHFCARVPLSYGSRTNRNPKLRDRSSGEAKARFVKLQDAPSDPLPETRAK